MKKKICILHANCQGDPVKELLCLNLEFSEIYDIYNFTNYTREIIPENLIAKCDLFLYQHLGKNWKELGSEFIISKLNNTAKAIPFPSMFFKHYWPLWSSIPGFDYRDNFLDSLLEKDLTESQILHLYLNTKLTNIYDFEEILKASLRHERQKENISIINYVDLVMANYKQERLFNTVNHPRKKILTHIVNSILEKLNMSLLTKEAVAEFPEPFAEFEQPIHPQVAEYLGLEFGSADERYNVYGAKLTFEEYAMRYIKCRMHGIDDFITFLRAAARRKDNSPS
ncbi:WcbI family polysaccharide biosynthesis putative acetyltransferase [Maridesulfovibrio zosterae]|uniref:WcbI family polysaccharide biosynthesis putative acetyltransferase n=1 Tax=Maridesulfovibrio zosterae TaxID=82171 RepID=UPI000421DE70|nr:WcbI family polysaccharide biosynthesis putative acetyltransferase [Maridesulfovibrio zosterae]